MPRLSTLTMLTSSSWVISEKSSRRVARLYRTAASPAPRSRPVRHAASPMHLTGGLGDGAVSLGRQDLVAALGVLTR